MSFPTVLIACGAGIATSTIVCERVERLLKEHQIRAQVIQCMISEVSALQDGASLIISTTILPTTYKIPSIIATAYISGVGMEELDQKILNHLKNNGSTRRNYESRSVTFKESDHLSRGRY